MPDMPPNGTREFPRATTPELSASLYDAAAADEAVQSAEDFLDALAEKLVSKVGNGGGGGHQGPPRKEFLGLTAGSWIRTMAGMLIAGVITAGAWVLLVRDTLKEHGAQIEEHQALPMHKDASKAVEEFDERLGTVETAVQSINTKQTQVISGIDELKKENLDKLKTETAELKAENRRLERAARRGR
jgi:hypothetical protein